MTHTRESKPALLLLLLATLLLGSTNSVAQVNVSLPDVNATVSEQITIPVTVGDLTGLNVYSYEITIVYDPAVLNLTGVSTSGTRSSAAGASVVPNTNNPGEIRIAAASGSAFSGSGTLVNLLGTVAGSGTTDVTFTKMVFNVGNPAAVTTNGSVSTETAGESVQVNIPDLDGMEGEAVTVPVEVDDVTGREIYSYEFTLHYDADVITLTSADISGTISTSSPVINTNTPGEIVVVFASATALSGSGTLVKLRGEALSEGTTTLSFDRFVFNTGTPAASTTSGTFASINLPPLALELAVTTDMETPVEIVLQGMDPEGKPLDFAVVEGPENGSLGEIVVETDTTASVTYTPNEDFHGTDSFTFSVSDGERVATGSVTITVVSVNAAPSASAIVSPATGASFTIGGGPGENPVAGDEVLFEVSWEASDDPEGDAVQYIYQVAADATFQQIVGSSTFSAQTNAEVTVAEAAALFDLVTGRMPGNIDIGGTVTLHHRIITTDGENETIGTVSSVVLVRGTITSSEPTDGIPGTFRLDGNYPNPFNPSTTIRFDLPESAEVSVQVVDLLGRQVLEVAAQAVAAGAGRSVRLEAASLGSGTYIYRLVARSASEVNMQTGKMTIVK